MGKKIIVFQFQPPSTDKVHCFVSCIWGESISSERAFRVLRLAWQKLHDNDNQRLKKENVLSQF